MRNYFTLAVLFIFQINLFAQPANDDCAGIINLGEAPICPAPEIYTNQDATLSTVFSDATLNIPLCFEGGIVDRDVWFSFSVPASGDLVDFTITVSGVDGPNGSMEQPQVAVYRGDCELDGLQELDCATSGLGENSVEFDLLGLTPGLTYFLRIADWSASASPNWGDFELCIDEYDPVFNIGEVASTESCAGVLFDSGGPDGDYENGENFTFVICPNEFHQCIFFDVVDFNIETGFDNLTFFAGNDVNAPQITNLTGAGGTIELQAFSNCVTVQFTSDGSQTDTGFELLWQCSPDTCTVAPPSTCDDPNEISGLPYIATELTTCGAGNSITTSPCNTDAWLNSDDVVFTYTSPGDECISVEVTGANAGTGVGVFGDCPNVATNCLGQAGGGFNPADPVIPAVFLEEPGTYYIVVDNNTVCTPFDIEIQTVDCPVVFPSAALCEDGLSLNGCSPDDLPAIISVAPGEGDPDFIQGGVNQGCWGGGPANYTWFFFQAQEDGDFTFLLDAANPAEASDIDFLIWGPILDPLDICDFAASNEPVRGSYAAGADPTGLAAIHPITGIDVTDECEMAGGDDFVAPLPVLMDEYYVVLINDWGGAIQSGAITIGFDGTTPGVLGASNSFQVSADTSLCPGESAQLFASGGDVYQWFPADGLSCVNCPNPVATLNNSTVYQVAINSLCVVDTLEVEVGLLQVDAGPDVTACIGEEIQIVAGSNFTGVQYAWNAPAGFLSCTDCPDPIVTAQSSGTFTLEVIVTGPTCSFSDEMILEILAGTAPVYDISEDQALCVGETIDLGGPATPGITYSWTSEPAGFVSDEANPSVTPSESIVYYLEIVGPECPIPSFDSVLVSVANLPVIAPIDNVSLCVGESVTLAATVPESGVVYTWTPADGLDNPNSPNPVATPTQTTEYSLLADRNGCSESATVLVEVTELGVAITNPDTTGICRDVEVSLAANAFPVGTVINWTPDDGSLDQLTGPNVTAAPQTATSYVAAIEFNGCTKFDTVYIGVDSLPWDLAISPIDTQICQGELVTLTSATYEPADFMDIGFQWSGDGQLTPDSLFNMVVQPSVTTEYTRISTNGFCSETTTATVTVITVNDLTVEPAQPAICLGDTVQLNVSAPVDVDFTWTPATGLSCSDCPNPIANPTSTTTYMIEADFDGCPVAISVTVVVGSPPFVDFPAGVLCPGEALILNAAPNPSWSYTWSSPDDPTFSSTDPAPSVNPTQTTSYTVTVDNGICPPITESLLVQVNDDTPEITTSGDEVICLGQGVELTAESNVQATIFWTPGNTTGNALSITPGSLAEGLYEYTASIVVCGDTISETLIVEVVPGIIIDSLTIEPNDTVFEGTNMTLTVFTDVEAASYQWSTGGTAMVEETAALLIPQENYSVTVTDALGCTATLDDVVVVEPSMWEIPNVFTPNNDDVNSMFQVVIAGENIEVTSFQVWNRWGKLVFDATGEAALAGWDGSQDGDPAPSDVYVYRIVLLEPDGTEVQEKGDVTLLR